MNHYQYHTSWSYGPYENYNYNAMGNFNFSANTHTHNPFYKWGLVNYDQWIPQLPHVAGGYSHSGCSTYTSQPVVQTSGKHNSRENDTSKKILPTDVKISVLPLYQDVKNVLTEEYFASFFQMVRNYYFKIDPGLAVHTREDYEILLRMCLLDTKCEQDDAFPPNARLRINRKTVFLADVGYPITITNLCKKDASMNILRISSQNGNMKNYVIKIAVVRNKEVKDACRNIKKRSLQGSLNWFKKSMHKIEEGDEVKAAGHYVSLQCPVGKKRIEVPCRASSCKHLQCFDASSFLQMNQRKSTWLCPVCHKSANFENLEIDGFIEEILRSCGSSVMKIEVNSDGNWKPVVDDEKSEKGKKDNLKAKKRILFIDLVDDSNDAQYLSLD